MYGKSETCFWFVNRKNNRSKQKHDSSRHILDVKTSMNYFITN